MRLWMAESRSFTQKSMDTAKKKAVTNPTTRLVTIARGTVRAGSKQLSVR